MGRQRFEEIRGELCKAMESVQNVRVLMQGAQASHRGAHLKLAKGIDKFEEIYDELDRWVITLRPEYIDAE